jgi:hypothetical protein
VRSNRIVIVVAALALAAGASTAAGAGGEGVVASAGGGYTFSGPVPGGFIEVHPFAWNVTLDADGSVHGLTARSSTRITSGSAT